MLATLNPQGKSSMRQYMVANRHSELELFGGTVLNLARKHNISALVNKELYERIKDIESQF
ncbi:ketopantoate reductase family protein [Virgibacillus halodenitrificans]|uniref:ketopantoate reductase family protein n=1 Tax=Virgibacillus halodenitrificans TaxID=1482 RepID=UPI0023788EED|nr:ketopantoate reductase C-terminal domain-containing protein [Virgibacillus halodenitrificans]MEC2159725.1 ketopantoate reductase C-terminal domain-containing protein [Virgibacillus halodenitrificans]